MARVDGERLADALRERFGAFLHDAYRKRRLEIAKLDGDEEQVLRDSSMRDWNQLDEELGESNRLHSPNSNTSASTPNGSGGTGG